MLNQLRFERNDFREFSSRFHKIIINKKKIMKSLYKFELII